MSEEYVELVRRTYEVINAVGRTSEAFVDPEALNPELWAQFDPAFELHERSDLPDRKIYRGRDESKAFWRKTQEVFSEIRWEPKQFLDLGDAVLVETRIVATGRGSDVAIEVDETDVFWFRDGRIARLQGFPTPDEAMAAAKA
jgi:ketosteroid isomerase-like protein